MIDQTPDRHLCSCWVRQTYVHILVAAVVEHDDLASVGLFGRGTEQLDSSGYIMLLQRSRDCQSGPNAGDCYQGIASVIRWTE